MVSGCFCIVIHGHNGFKLEVALSHLLLQVAVKERFASNGILQILCLLTFHNLTHGPEFSRILLEFDASLVIFGSS